MSANKKEERNQEDNDTLLERRNTEVKQLEDEKKPDSYDLTESLLNRTKEK